MLLDVSFFIAQLYTTNLSQMICISALTGAENANILPTFYYQVGINIHEGILIFLDSLGFRNSGDKDILWGPEQ